MVWTQKCGTDVNTHVPRSAKHATGRGAERTSKRRKLSPSGQPASCPKCGNTVSVLQGGKCRRCSIAATRAASALSAKQPTEVLRRGQRQRRGLGNRTNNCNVVSDQAHFASVEKPMPPPEPESPHASPASTFTEEELDAHLVALKTEYFQRTLRPILTKLMTHTSNRSLFNTQVDPIALKLPDYFSIIKCPMDLGTIKSKLLALKYQDMHTFAEDVRLVFANARTYNPPGNWVHEAAKLMAEEFEKDYERVCSRAQKTVQKASEHTCTLCEGRECGLCGEKCIKLDPPVLLCQGPCLQRIKKGAIYYVSKDGIRLFCQKCHAAQPAVLPVLPSDAEDDEDEEEGGEETVYRRAEFLKRRFDDELVEPWVRCDDCQKFMHQICALFNPCSPPGDNAPAAASDPNAPSRGKFYCPGCKLQHEASRRQQLEQQRQKEWQLQQQLLLQRQQQQFQYQVQLQFQRQQQQQKQELLLQQQQQQQLLQQQQQQQQQQQHQHEREQLLQCQGAPPSQPQPQPQPPLPFPLLQPDQDLLHRRAPLSPLTVPKQEAQVLDARSAPPLSLGSDARTRVSMASSESELKGGDYSTDSGAHSDVASTDCESARLFDSLDSLSSHEASHATECEVASAMAVDDRSEASPSPIDQQPMQEPVTEPVTEARALWSAETLPETKLSQFIQGMVRSLLRNLGESEIAETVHIRVVSNMKRCFRVHKLVRDNFVNGGEEKVTDLMPYTSKAILMFQKIDGVDLCLFSMYVQEYDKDSPEPNCRRVYIAYLDSVEYFRPRTARTQVYHEILVSYLLWCRLRGFRMAHIWACPPQRGNTFIYWCHPQHQKTPSKDRLLEWYRKMLERAKEAGAVHDSTNLFEEYFKDVRAAVANDTENHKVKPLCPPVFDGDFWVDEVCRLYNLMQRRAIAEASIGSQSQSAKQLCERLLKSLREHPSASPFNVPVDPVAHCALDYFDIIKQPMDLATALAKIKSGQYRALLEFKEDIDLIFSNAMRYNPPMHTVHEAAVTLRAFYVEEFQKLLGRCVGREKATEQEMARTALLESIRMCDAIPPLPTMIKEEPPREEVPPTQEAEGQEEQGVAGDSSLSAGSQHQVTPQTRSLPHEVSRSVERLKGDLLVLHLQAPDNQQSGDVVMAETPSYAQPFIDAALASIKFGDTADPDQEMCNHLVDSRHTFLELCQFRNYQFDTLRRAKHSSAMVLYHLLNTKTTLHVSCSACGGAIYAGSIRWHCGFCTVGVDLCCACSAQQRHTHKNLTPYRVSFGPYRPS